MIIVIFRIIHHKHQVSSLEFTTPIQGLVNVPMFHITQLLGIFHLQQIWEGDVKQIPKKGHLPTPVSEHNICFVETNLTTPICQAPMLIYE